MIQPHTRQEQALNEQLLKLYKDVAEGICMASIRYEGDASVDPCDGGNGDRHAISKNHLELIARPGDTVRANREIASFDKFAEKYDRLQRVPISKFSAGKWSCQKHDQRFAEIDRPRINLAKPENLFKVVYRAMARHNLWSMARWIAMHNVMQSENGWSYFVDTGFKRSVTQEEADQAFNQWGKCAQALLAKMKEFEERMRVKEWDSLDYRAVVLASDASVAGWGCPVMKRSDRDFFEFAYMVVIPQKEGHAIITACEKESRFGVPERTLIHDSMPRVGNPNIPYQPNETFRRRMSKKFWGLTELGLRESLYQSWSGTRQRRVQHWMTGQQRARLLTHPEKAPDDLPLLLRS